MWLGIAGAYLFCLFLAVLHLWPVDCHLPSSHSTPSSKVDLHCDLAEYCVHDTIPVCGKMGDEKKTFLDMCDMIEYVCDTNKKFPGVGWKAGMIVAVNLRRSVFLPRHSWTLNCSFCQVQTLFRVVFVHVDDEPDCPPPPPEDLF